MWSAHAYQVLFLHLFTFHPSTILFGFPPFPHLPVSQALTEGKMIDASLHILHSSACIHSTIEISHKTDIHNIHTYTCTHARTHARTHAHTHTHTHTCRGCRRQAHVVHCWEVLTVQSQWLCVCNMTNYMENICMARLCWNDQVNDTSQKTA